MIALLSLIRNLSIAIADPIDSTERAVSLIEKSGTLATVVLCCSLIVTGMVMVIVILWRRLDASITMIQNIQAAHYETMIERAARDTEEKHRLADNLEKHAEAMRALRETLVLINDRVGHRV